MTVCHRLGWLILVMTFGYFTFSICYNQMTRFINDPFVLTVDTNHRSWIYYVPGVTFCTNYESIDFIEDFYKRATNRSIDYGSKDYQYFRHDVTLLGSITAESIDSLEEMKNMTKFKSFSGDELLDFVINVCASIHNFSA